MDTFYLGHTVLYAKGYYKQKDLLEDLKTTLESDGYIVFGKKDIKELLLNLYAKLPYHGFSQLRNLEEGLNPHNAWKVGYYTKQYMPAWINLLDKDELSDYDYETSVIYFVLSYIKMAMLRDFDKKLPEPNKKVLPLWNDNSKKV